MLSIGDLRNSHDQEKPTPCLRVKDCLDYMFPSPLSRDNSHLISSESFDSNIPFVSTPEFSFHRGIREEYDGKDGEDQGEATTVKEYYLVR
jgi:hypothetical protein